jgi:hypothetical protein
MKCHRIAKPPLPSFPFPQTPLAYRGPPASERSSGAPAFGKFDGPTAAQVPHLNLILVSRQREVRSRPGRHGILVQDPCKIERPAICDQKHAITQRRGMGLVNELHSHTADLRMHRDLSKFILITSYMCWVSP